MIREMRGGKLYKAAYCHTDARSEPRRRIGADV